MFTALPLCQTIVLVQSQPVCEASATVIFRLYFMCDIVFVTDRKLYIWISLILPHILCFRDCTGFYRFSITLSSNIS